MEEVRGEGMQLGASVPLVTSTFTTSGTGARSGRPVVVVEPVARVIGSSFQPESRSSMIKCRCRSDGPAAYSSGEIMPNGKVELLHFGRMSLLVVKMLFKRGVAGEVAPTADAVVLCSQCVVLCIVACGTSQEAAFPSLSTFGIGTNDIWLQEL